MGMFVLLIPIAINVLAVVCWRGWMRWLAVILLCIACAAFGLDLYQMTEGSNRTGLFTIYTDLLSLAALFLIAAASFVVESICSHRSLGSDV